MTLVAALGRIDDIQQRIRSLSPEPVVTDAAAATTGTTGGATSASASAFASAVRDAGGVGEVPALPAGPVDGGDIVAQAKQYLGVPYVFGGEDRSGMDCSGLVQRVLADLGIDAPRVVQDQADIGVEVPSLADARPGDLIVTKGEGHIVIYAGDGMVIHAPSPGKHVELRDNWLKDADIATIRRVVPPPGEGVAAAGIAAASGLPASALSALSVPALSAAVSSPTSMAAAARTALAAVPVASRSADAGGVADALASLIAAASVPSGVAASEAAASGAAASRDGAAGAGVAALAAAGGSTTAAASPATAAAAPTTPAVSPAPAEPVASPSAVAAAAGLTPSAVTSGAGVAAPAAPAPPTATPPTPLAPQLTTPLVSLARSGQGEHTLTLRVSPEDLGPVTVKARITGSSVTIELASGTVAGRDALRALLVDLRRDLAVLVPHSSIAVTTADAPRGDQLAAGTGGSAGGASGASTSGQPFGQGGSDGSGRERATPPAPAAPVLPPSADALPLPAPTAASAATGIDLFA
ncbi:NlpC/P60 family protein [Microbacterium sp. PA5]|uniref:NlpC/P60 family protein n=1 Tax=Microbacterium sp. PA5 TaxID=3416654 RepID=UPI003CF81536